MANSKSPRNAPTVPLVPSKVATVKLAIIAVGLVVVTVVAGHVGPFRPMQKVAAPHSSAGMARCEQLYVAWAHSDGNDGSDARGPNMRAAKAMADCERGDFVAGTAELERLLRYEGKFVPPAQTAVAR